MESQQFFPAKSTLIREGDPHDDTLYILNEGRVGIYKKDKLIAEITESGSFFGEMSAILQTPRTATVRAIIDCKVTPYKLDFDNLCAKFPRIAQKLVVALAHRLQDLTDRYEKNVQRIRKMEEDFAEHAAAMEKEMGTFLKELSKAEIEKSRIEATHRGSLA